MSGKNNKLITSCYEPTYGKTNGWCATCVPEAKKGEQGYCGEDQSHSQDSNSEILVVSPNSTDWGFCDPKCKRKRDVTMLEVRVSKYCQGSVVKGNKFFLKKINKMKN